VVALKDANVKSFADLKGKSVVTQPKGNTAEVLTDQVLKLNGLNYQSLSKVNFQASYTDAVVDAEGRPRAGHDPGNHRAGLVGHGPRERARHGHRPGRRQDHGGAEEAERRIQQAHHQGGHVPKQDKDVAVIGYSTHIIAAVRLARGHDLQDDQGDGRARRGDGAVVKPITGLTAEGHGGGHRRALPQGRREVLQGSRRPLGARRLAQPAAAVVSDEAQATAPPWRALAIGVTLVAVAMSLYHMYVAAFGPPDAVDLPRHPPPLRADARLRPCIRCGRTLRAGGGWRTRAAGARLGFVLHILLNYEYFTSRILYIDELTAADKFYSVVAIVITLEATRRIIGWALPLTAIAFLIYAIAFTHVTPAMLMEQLYLSTEGSSARPSACRQAT
jgi:hypothetical protein